MTIAISFDSLVFTTNNNMINFPDGYDNILDIQSRVFNSNSRVGGILITDAATSVPINGVYTILGPVGTERATYSNIRDKRGDIGSLVIGALTIPNVALKMVSKPIALGAGALQCALTFELLVV